ncbi:hypothetical protein [Amnibacterium endophyticum]|uniref:Uncharacterized protein n=1 Tax=Amnibacterium endophyticum TaxID=2109337 RepID=A0ABW4LHG8_9MICO
MARLTDDDFDALRAQQDRARARPLGALRSADGEQRGEALDAWITAGDTLAEKAIAALDAGDDERAAALVRRIVDLPVVDGSTRTGLMAVDLVLVGEVLEPLEEGDAAGLLERPLRLLPDLPQPVADELRHVLAALTDYDLPAAVRRRIAAVVPLEDRLQPPFSGVPEDELPAAVTGVLRLVLRLRSDG